MAKRIAVFDCQSYDREFLGLANADHGFHLEFLEPRLTPTTAGLAEGHDAVCVFVNDVLNRDTLGALADMGIRHIGLRCSGFNHVDIEAASEYHLHISRVPAYSPHAVAEHCIGLILALNRHIHRAFNRVRECNFALDGLLGFDLHGRCVGVVGTGRIGVVVARILLGFGCRVLAYDPFPDKDLIDEGVIYVGLNSLLMDSDVITLHCPLTQETTHLIDTDAIARMREGVMLVNTSRGALIDAKAVISGLKSGRIGSLALDVYEEESDLFFRDLSQRVIHDDVFTRLLTFPNVLITGHQAFFTREALHNIATTTLGNLADSLSGTASPNLLPGLTGS